MFNDRLKAIQLCVNRFDTDTKTAFIDLYTKVDAGVDLNEETTEVKVLKMEMTMISKPIDYKYNEGGDC